jgi:AcrR family transcriptional regulator
MPGVGAGGARFPARPSGRRPGLSGSRTDILGAARERFAAAGYDQTTIRAIARDAGVDPALVHHFFGTKDALFAAAMELPLDPGTAIPALLAGGVDGLGERLVRFYVGLWESDAAPAMLTVLRSAVSHDEAAALLRAFVGREVIGRLASELHRDAPELRTTLVGSQLVGLAMVRYVVRIEPLCSADIEAVVAAVAPTIQRYLSADLGPTKGQQGWTA